MLHLPNILSKSSSRNLLNFLCRNSVGAYCPRRNLFAEERIGLVAFKESKNNARKIMDNTNQFKERLQNNCNSEKEYLVLSDDLKVMINICEDKEDIELLKKLVFRYHNQTKRLHFDEFHFGPQIIRLCYVLKNPQQALEFIYNDEYDNLFLSYTCYMLVMDLLFKNNMHEEVLKVYERYLEKQVELKKYASDLIMLYFASLYKIGTKEALDKGLNFYKELMNVKYNRIPLRGYTYLAMLAFNNGESFTAIELVRTISGASSGLNIKLQVLIKEGRFSDALYALKESLHSDEMRKFKLSIFSDTINILDKGFSNCEDKLVEQYQELKKQLESEQMLSTKTLEEFAFDLVGKLPARNLSHVEKRERFNQPRSNQPRSNQPRSNQPRSNQRSKKPFKFFN